MRMLDVIAAVLLVVGGLNWGLVGAFDFNLVNALAGSIPMLPATVYVGVGLAALYQVFGLRAIQQRWGVASQPVRATVGT